MKIVFTRQEALEVLAKRASEVMGMPVGPDEVEVESGERSAARRGSRPPNGRRKPKNGRRRRRRGAVALKGRRRRRTRGGRRHGPGRPGRTSGTEAAA
jgi:hypothetical protein